MEKTIGGNVFHRIKEAIDSATYAVASGEEAAAHYGETFSKWDRFVCWQKGLVSSVGRGTFFEKQENEMANKLTGMSEEDGARYEKLEKEHFGDYDKKTGIYAPKLASRVQTKEKTLGDEAKKVIEMSPDERERHYWDALKSGGKQAVNALFDAVEEQTTKETTLDPRVQKLLEMSPEEQNRITDTRTAVLINQLTDAECGLHAATLLDLNKDDEKYVKEFERDKKHAEHGLTNIVKGKTLESEVTAVLKMGSKARHEYYTEVLKSGGRKAVDELTSAVKKQRTKSNDLEM